MNRILSAGVCAFTLFVCLHDANGQRRLESGLHEIVIIQPDSIENGRPSVDLLDDPYGNGQRVEIKPTVHVHVNYYSGEREFQGPIIASGPAIIVANHPDTGERVYVPVSLPGGSPTVRHDSKGIEYIYKEDRVLISFSGRRPNEATVKHIRGRGFARTVHEGSVAVVSAIGRGLSSSATLTSIREMTVSAKDIVGGSVAAIDGAASQIVVGVTSLGQSIPGVSQLIGAGDDKAIDGSIESRNEMLRQGRQDRIPNSFRR